MTDIKETEHWTMGPEEVKVVYKEPNEFEIKMLEGTIKPEVLLEKEKPIPDDKNPEPTPEPKKPTPEPTTGGGGGGGGNNNPTMPGRLNNEQVDGPLVQDYQK